MSVSDLLVSSGTGGSPGVRPWTQLGIASLACHGTLSCTTTMTAATVDATNVVCDNMTCGSMDVGTGSLIAGDVTCDSLTIAGAGQVLVGDGSQAAPSIAFRELDDTGLYRRSGVALGVTVQGQDTGQWTTGGLSLLGGQLDVGPIVATGPLTMTGGSLFMPGQAATVGALTSDSLATTGLILAGDGSSSAPAYSFGGASGTGQYRSGASLVTSIAGTSVLTASATGVTIAGTLSCGTSSASVGALSSSSLTTTGLILAADGSATAPAFSYGSGSGTGHYRSATPAVVTSVGGVAVQTTAASGVTVAGQINCGTWAAVTGALSCTSLTSQGLLRVGDGSASLPSLSFSNAASTGFYRSGTSMFATVSGSQIVTFATTGIAVNGSVNNGTSALTTGSLSATRVTSTGTMSCGTNAMTCGALSCSSIASTGAVTQPRYALRLYMASTQSISTITTTAAIWDTVETSGGGATNWSFTPPSAVITAPIAGRYEISTSIVFEANATGYRQFWVEINPPAGVPGSTRRYAEIICPTTSLSRWGGSGTFTYQLAAGDTIVAAVYQNSGGALNVMGLQGNQGSAISVTRLSE